jgi:hypothetical protein
MAQQQTVERAGISPTLALEIQIADPVMTVWRENGSKVEFYEHPRYGDEAPAIALERGVYTNTGDVWDLSTARLYCGLDQ